MKFEIDGPLARLECNFLVHTCCLFQQPRAQVVVSSRVI